MTHPIPPDDDPPYSDDDAPDAPPTKTKRKQRHQVQPLRVVQPDEPASFDDDWRKSLRYKADGSVSAKDPGNAALFLTHDPEWKGVLCYNEFAHRTVWVKPAPIIPGLTPPSGELADVHAIYVQHWLAKFKHLSFSMDSVHRAIDMAAANNSSHPVRDYLRSLRWDAQQRLPTMLSRYFGAKPSTYLEQVGVAWMISGVARIMKPGCKVDHMLVLQGSQGARKSSALSILFGEEWFSDAKLDIGSDEAAKKLQGKWGIEVPELDGFRGRASSQVKAFITTQTDRFRASYGRHAKDLPRTCIFAGTTNEREIFQDRTGNRRFWPVTCGQIDRPAIQNDRDQLWAEAVARYDSGEKWWLEDESLAREEQRQREYREPWFELVSKWLESPNVPSESGGYTRLLLSEGITQADIFRGALGMRATDMNRDAQTRLGFVLQKLGLERRRRRTENGREYAYFQAGPTGSD